MDLLWQERPSDSPLVDAVWRNRSEQAGPFISMAESQFELVITCYRGTRFLTVRGPATAASPAYAPAEAEFVGILFKPGVFMPALPASQVMERHELNLPEATRDSFWLNSSVWQYPDFENADTFVERLVREGLLVRDPIVSSVLEGQVSDVSSRTVRRRFLRATGLTHGTLFQIERARYATRLLKQGVSILDTISLAGYFDQPHLTRSLKRYIGLTPAQVADEGRGERLSILYKQNPVWLGYNSANNSEIGLK
jgi:AraC-like DNA-binding protein